MSNKEISIETRMILMERDLELLKLRDSDLKSWQEGVNRSLYKMEALEKALDDTRETMDEVLKMMRESKSEENVILKKIQEMTEKKEQPKTVWEKNLERIIQIVFIALLIIAATLGLKIPAPLGGV